MPASSDRFENVFHFPAASYIIGLYLFNTLPICNDISF
jgi:hypothetical protein